MQPHILKLREEDRREGRRFLALWFFVFAAALGGIYAFNHLYRPYGGQPIRPTIREAEMEQEVTALRQELERARMAPSEQPPSPAVSFPPGTVIILPKPDADSQQTGKPPETATPELGLADQAQVTTQGPQRPARIPPSVAPGRRPPTR